MPDQHPDPTLLPLPPFLSPPPPPLPLCSEQSTEQNRAAFDEFVAAWNARRLPARLYKGEVGAARTSHAWGIKGQPARPPARPPASQPAQQFASPWLHALPLHVASHQWLAESTCR